MSRVFVVSSARSATMRAIRSKGTAPERALGQDMWRAGLRYRKHVPDVPGHPDFVFARSKVAVFVDGSFWHGYDWQSKRERIRTNRDYWIPKIERNIARDIAVNRSLGESGWCVLRFWDFQVLQSRGECVRKVKLAIGERSAR